MAGTNCAARPKAAQPTVAQPTEAQPTEAELVAAQPPTVRPATVQQVGKRRKFSQTCLPVGGKRREKPPIAKKVKAGRKKGIPTTSNITRGQWYHACKIFRELKGVKMGQAEFLRGNRSDSIFTASGSQKTSFSNWLKKYDKGELKDSDMKREKTRTFVDVEVKLCEYLRLRAQQYKKDKCGVSWLLIKEKCNKWALELGHKKGVFSASDGWLNKSLQRH